MGQGKENESAKRIKGFMCMMDSMTTKELDSPNPKIWAEPSRIMRIARGCGRHPLEVQELIGAPAQRRSFGIPAALTQSHMLSLDGHSKCDIGVQKCCIVRIARRCGRHFARGA